MQARVQATKHNSMREATGTAPAATVPGLSLLLDFVTEEEERALLLAVQAGQWQVLAKRRVCHFGHAFDYLVRYGCSRKSPACCLHWHNANWLAGPVHCAIAERKAHCPGHLAFCLQHSVTSRAACWCLHECLRHSKTEDHLQPQRHLLCRSAQCPPRTSSQYPARCIALSAG